MGLRMGVFLLLLAVLQAGTVRLPLFVLVGVLAASAIGGCVFGLLLPLGRSRIGATLMGPLVLGPLVGTQALLDYHYSGDDAYSGFAYLTTVVLVGGLAGYGTRALVFPELDE